MHLPEMGFSKVPIELITHIATFLEYDSDLNSFARTSKFLHRLLNDYLYRHNVLYFGSSALEWAALNGAAATARKALAAGALPSTCVDEEWQPMAVAAIHGHEQVVKVFLDLGLDPCREQGWRPLTEEFQNQELHDEEGNLNGDYKADSDPLSLAIAYGSESVVQLLITHGATKNWNSQNEIAAMHLAVTGGYLAVVKLLAELFPERIHEATDSHERSLLSVAMYNNELEIVRFLASLGADLNAECTKKIVPLGWAARFGDYEAINFFVDNGACPDPMMGYDATLWPLRWAAERENYDAVDYLLSKIDVKAKISKGGEDVNILLFVAALRGLESLLREILASGCDANSFCDWGYANLSAEPRSALSAAAQTGRVDIATILLEHGANLYGYEPLDEYANYDPEYQPLFSACRGGHIEVVKLLLDHGLDLKKAETERQSSVIAAMGFPQIINLLLSRGADGQGQFPLDDADPMTKAIRSGHLACIQVLLNHNVPVKPSAFFALNESPISEASKADYEPAILNLLAEHTEIPLPENKDMQEALRKPIQRGSAEVTEFFLQRGFDPNSKWAGHPRFSRSYLEDALHASDPKDAEATISVLLRYGADIRDLQNYPPADNRGANPLPESPFGLSLLEFAARTNSKTFLRGILRYIDAQNLPFADIQRNFSLVASNAEVQKNWHAMNIWKSFYWRNRYPMSS
ncbi:unnamed protein product [Penicillium bialowiezense]